MNFKKYKYAIMDYDGTLLDSMHYWRSALSRCVKNIGLEPKEDLDKLEPNSLIDLRVRLFLYHF